MKMQILVNDEPVDALSPWSTATGPTTRGRAMCEKLKELIPQHMFKVPIQAAVGGRIIARETLVSHAQRRDGEVLRRRRLAQAQVVGQAEGW